MTSLQAAAAVAARPPARLGRLAPGVAICLIIALAAQAAAPWLKAPPVLVALLCGLVLNAALDRTWARPGFELAARPLLRVGVALLGAQITLGAFVALGRDALVVVAATVLALMIGAAVGRRLGLGGRLAVVSAGAVAICGASAALTLGSLWRGADGDEEVAATVAGVTLIGSAAMILYPPLASGLGFTPVETGVFLGGSLHEVAQAVGAGFSVSPRVGEIATTIKLVRVACLAPIAALILLARPCPPEGGMKGPPLAPWFLVGFVALAGAASLHAVPSAAGRLAADASRLLLLTAIAALGLKTSLGRIVAAGPVLLLAMLFDSALVAGLVAGGLRLARLA